MVAPMAVSSAAPAAGTWVATVRQRFPEVAEALELTQGMNTVARQASPGTVLVIERDGTNVCVEH